MDITLANINEYSKKNIQLDLISESEYQKLNEQFFNAVLNKDISLIKSLANLGANLSSIHTFKLFNHTLNIYQEIPMNIISFCIINQEIELIKLFKELEYNLRFQKDTYLFFSCGYGNSEITQFFINQGSNTYLNDERFLLLAIENSSHEPLNVLKTLLQSGGDIYFNNPKSLITSQFLEKAILWNKLDSVKFLVEYGAFIQTYHFHQANEENAIPILEFLFDQNIPYCSYLELKKSFGKSKAVSYFDAKELCQHLENTLPEETQNKTKIKL